ncbi:hypothetical protein [Coleofasciculus sp. E1-EBD-02]|uniref:hypothetical protein n=1 Tax=Coleofasciculus sp. E1-EBD-02 TaxID=3068481 RepID=UPI0032F46D89
MASTTALVEMRGNFVQNVSRMVQRHDLLRLTASTHPSYLLAIPTLGGEPEAIARTQQDTSIIVVHFPSSS